MKVEPGRRVAVDGLVVSGSVAIDESMLTGESTLVLKEPGTRVVAGSSPMEGSAVVRATAVGASTGIARIVDLVRSAQASKPPIQAAADAVSAVFVPAIVAFSVITFVAWFGAAESGHVPRAWMSAEGPFLFSFLFAIATIVIACPCALGLAVPTVVMVASGADVSSSRRSSISSAPLYALRQCSLRWPVGVPLWLSPWRLPAPAAAQATQVAWQYKSAG